MPDDAPDEDDDHPRPDAATAPGSAVGDEHGALDDAPEPNEPA